MNRKRIYAVATLCLLALPASVLPDDDARGVRDAASREAIVRDWMLQDLMRIELPQELDLAKRQWQEKYLRTAESRQDQVVLEYLPCFESRQGNLVEQRMLARVAEDLGEGRNRIEARVGELIESQIPSGDRRWKAIYIEACELRRAKRLEALQARWKRFVFDQHPHVGPSWKYTEVLSDAQTNKHRYFKAGASLQELELNGIYGQVRTLLEDRKGLIRNPDVSYDGNRILFAWKKSDREDDFHLYEMDAQTRRMRQLTSDQGFADYEGVYLPDGNILFSSTRCCQTVDCNWVEASNLYLMDADGRFLRRVGFDQVHTIFPTVTDDGRVLYTRWEYNDRAQIFVQPLFQMHPDGTGQSAFYGGNSWFPTNILHARKIPGSSKTVAIVTGHHRPPQGKLALIDPAKGRQEGQGVELIAPARVADYQRVDGYAPDGIQYQYPYPLSEEQFLVTMALPTAKGVADRFNIYWIDRDGRRELLVEGQEPGSGTACRQIVPLAPRTRPHVRPSTVDYRQATGTITLHDVYQGPGLQGIPRGTIRELRVVALEFRAAAIGSLQQKGRGGDSEVTTPVAVANGSWDVKVVLGSAKVHEDGSAMFRVPARTPVYFQAIDAKGHAVQTMRSWTTLMPGEAQSCVGCHETRNGTPGAELQASLAMRAGPQSLVPFYGPARGFSFAREIQPILDRHCVRCHTGEPDKPINLTSQPVLLGATKRKFSQSYLSLTHAQRDRGDWEHRLVNWIDSMSEPVMLPAYHRGAATSELMKLLDQGHEGVKLTEEDRNKLACWIDLLVPYCGDYREANAWSQKEEEFYAKALAKRDRAIAAEESGLRAFLEASRSSPR